MKGLQQTEDERGREMNSATCEFLQTIKFRGRKRTPQPTATLAKQKTKNCDKKTCK